MNSGSTTLKQKNGDNGMTSPEKLGWQALNRITTEKDMFKVVMGMLTHLDRKARFGRLNRKVWSGLN